MPQIFSARANSLAPAVLGGGLALLGISAWALHEVYWSPFTTRIGAPLEQPVPFSHKHHVDGFGIDCRYCHNSVEKSAFAGMPSTETCMSCHSQLWTDAPLLAPVRESFARNQPLRWTRVHDLPDFVFFNHSIHVKQGIGCARCHGPVNEMPLTWQQNTLYMKWCLECHRAPQNFIRPREQVFNMTWVTNQPAAGRELLRAYHVNATQLTDCSVPRAGQPARLHAPAHGTHRSLRPPAGRTHSRQTAVLRHRHDARRFRHRPARRKP